MKSLRLIITGDVQGVGFRGWFHNEAKMLQLTGWVKNRPDGAVEAVIEGDEKNVFLMIEKARTGPMTAWVKTLETEEIAKNPSHKIFEVIY